MKNKLLVFASVVLSVLFFSCQKNEIKKDNRLLTGKDWVTNTYNGKLIYRFEDNGIFTLFYLKRSNYGNDKIVYNDTTYNIYKEQYTWNWDENKINSILIYIIGHDEPHTSIDIKSISKNKLVANNLFEYGFVTFEKNNEILKNYND